LKEIVSEFLSHQFADLDHNRDLSLAETPRVKGFGKDSTSIQDNPLKHISTNYSECSSHSAEIVDSFKVFSLANIYW
jgi:hypothetical protein